MACTINGLDAIQIEVAWTTPPLSMSPVYQDIAADGEQKFEGFRTSRGRNSEIEQFEAGTLELRALNTDRAFEALYSASPYYPNVKPRRKIRVSPVYQGVPYPIYTGFTRRVRESYPEFGRDARAVLPATDGFLALSKTRITMNFDEVEESGERIRALLDAAHWPGFGLMTSPQHRELDYGNSEVQAQHLVDTPVLEAIYHVELSEFGQFFINAAGGATFRERRAIYLDSHYSTPQAIFGDNPDGSEIFYTDVGFSDDDERIRNRVVATRQGGQPQIASDAASIMEYFESVEPVPELLLLSDNEAFDYAHYRLSRDKLPQVRVEPITLNPFSDPDAIWPIILMDSLRCRFTVRKRPPGGGPFREVEVHIEGVDHDVSFKTGTWQTTFRLSIADPSMPWILEAPGMILGTNTFYGF